MKILFFSLALLAAGTACAQTTVLTGKKASPAKQSTLHTKGKPMVDGSRFVGEDAASTTPVFKIGGGEARRLAVEIKNQEYVRLEGNANMTKIESFDLQIIKEDGTITKLSNKGNKLESHVLKAFEDLAPKDKLAFSNIKVKGHSGVKVAPVTVSLY